MPSFTQTFGGTNIYPASVSYRAFALTADVTLSWPTEVATNQNVVAQIMDVTPSAGGFSIIMPPANEASVGETTLIFNVGSHTFTVKDNAGNAITTIAAGLAYQIYMTSNSTVAGSWRSVQFGAGTSSATAGSLVGYGIKAIDNTLNQSTPVVSLVADFVIEAPSRASAYLWEGGAGSLTFDSCATLGNDFFCHIRNGGTGAISVAPSVGGQLIDGDTEKFFNPGDSAIVVCDGSNLFTIGFGQAPEFLFDYVSIDLTAETSPYTLTGANLNRIAYRFSGTLTGNMEVIVPATIQQYWPANETDVASAPYTITIKTLAGTGVALARGARAIVYCNGTDVVDADTSTVSLPVSIAQGGTGATTASSARINLGGTATGIAVFTAANALAARVAMSAASSGANSDITSLTGLTTPLSVAQGGTGGANATDARTNLLAAKSGANSDITSLAGLTTPLSVAQGGSGRATLTANNLVAGNGTGQVNLIAPGTAGNILTSNGTSFSSAAPRGVGPDIIIQNQQTSGTAGAVLTVAAWSNRVINTVVRDVNSVVTLASNKITLPAGTWSFVARCPSYSPGNALSVPVSIRIYNNTDASVVGIGENVNLAPDTGILQVASGVTTIAGAKDFYIQYYISSGVINISEGQATSAGAEVYCTVEITQIYA